MNGNLKFQISNLKGGASWARITLALWLGCLSASAQFTFSDVGFMGSLQQPVAAGGGGGPVMLGNVQSAGSTYFTVSWGSDVATSNNLCVYSLNADLSSSSSVTDPAAPSTSHGVTVSGLSSSTTYYYQYQGTANGLTGYSATNSVTTAGAFPSGLTAYWKMDETSGVRADSIGSQSLTAQGGAASAAGKIGNAGDCHVWGTYFTHADDATLSVGVNTSFTLSLWVKLTDTNNNRTLIYKGTGTQATLEFDIDYCQGCDAFRFSMANGTVQANVNDTWVKHPTLNAWHLVTAWFDYSVTTLYIQVDNNTPVSVAWSGGNGQDTTGVFNIGGDTINSNYSYAYLDEIGYWKRVLTAPERASLWNSGNGLTY